MKIIDDGEKYKIDLGYFTLREITFMTSWCNENLNMPDTYDRVLTTGFIHFKTKDEAITFKMVWG